MEKSRHYCDAIKEIDILENIFLYFQKLSNVKILCAKNQK